MGWTYSGAPLSVTRDAVRFLVGQTSSSDPVILQDEEIDYLTATFPDTYIAAAEAAEQMAGRYGAKAMSKKVGDLSITYADRNKKFLERAADLRRTGGTRTLQPFAGGVSVSDMMTRSQDSDTVQPSFSVGFDERTFSLNPLTTQAS